MASDQTTEDTPEALKADIATLYQMNVDLTNEIERLREALTEYACPGRGACPAPWDEHGCSLRESDACGLIAADALAEVNP